MSYVRKLDSGKWQGIAKHKSGRRATKAFPLKGQASAWADDMEASWRAGTGRDPRAPKLTFGQWYTIWFAARVVADPERDTRNHKKLLLPYWRAWPLDTITRIDVMTWVAEMTKAGHSASEVERAYYGLAGALRAALLQTPALILANPCVKIPLPAKPPPPDRVFTATEMGAALGVLRQPWSTMVELAMWTGLRFGELAGLHQDAVLWDRDTVLVRKNRTTRDPGGPLKTPASYREIAVPPWVIEAMRTLLDARPAAAALASGGRIFTDPDGAALKYNTWNWQWKRACELARVPYAPPHTLRHTAASWLTEKGMDQYRVAALLGHASLKPTKRYSHLTPGAHVPYQDAWASIAADARAAGTEIWAHHGRTAPKRRPRPGS